MQNFTELTNIIVSVITALAGGCGGFYISNKTRKQTDFTTVTSQWELLYTKTKDEVIELRREIERLEDKIELQWRYITKLKMIIVRNGIDCPELEDNANN